MKKSIRGDWKKEGGYTFHPKILSADQTNPKELYEQGLDPGKFDHYFEVSVQHNGKPIGSVNAFGNRIDEKHGKVYIGSAELNTGHKGKGLGQAMYEHLYHHAAKNGYNKVVSTGASEQAQRVHQKIAEKHGLLPDTKPGGHTSLIGGMNIVYKNPFSKSMVDLMTKGHVRALIKGAQGDYRKEGITLHHEIKDNHVRITPRDREGTDLGHFAFDNSAKNKHTYPIDSRIYYTEHRRKGIATAAYSLAEKLTGKKMKPSPERSDSAKALWAQKNKPFGKSELAKGQKGNWQQEGYKFKVHPPKVEMFNGKHDITSHRITAHDSQGNHVGDYNFSEWPEASVHKGLLHVTFSNTDSDHQRKGLASAAYSLIEKQTGKKLHSSNGNRSVDAKQLWSQPNRPFGKDENDLVHYSRTKGLKQLDPNKMGTSGVGGAQYKRGIPENRSTFFYTVNSKPEDMVTQSASAKYIVRPKPEHKIYDLSTDPEHLMVEQRKRNQGAWNEDMLHSIVKEKGYHGVKWKMHDDTHVVQMYHPMDIHSEESLKSSENLNKTKSLPDDQKSIYNEQMAELLTKGFVRNAVVAGAMALAPQMLDKPANPPQANQAQPQANQAQQVDFGSKMLRTIAAVESSGGKNINHDVVNSGLNAGMKAHGKYGMMPLTIQETIKLDPQFKDHRHIVGKSGPETRAYVESVPGLEDKLAYSHLKRIKSHFGQDPAKIGMAWLNGIQGTKNAINQGKNLKEHWHVKKILSAFKGQ
jgi:GNAT superfamily N-acetyltransferase